MHWNAFLFRALLWASSCKLPHLLKTSVWFLIGVCVTGYPACSLSYWLKNSTIQNVTCSKYAQIGLWRCWNSGFWGTCDSYKWGIGGRGRAQPHEQWDRIQLSTGLCTNGHCERCSGSTETTHREMPVKQQLKEQSLLSPNIWVRGTNKIALWWKATEGEILKWMLRIVSGEISAFVCVWGLEMTVFQSYEIHCGVCITTSSQRTGPDLLDPKHCYTTDKQVALA